MSDLSPRHAPSDRPFDSRSASPALSQPSGTLSRSGSWTGPLPSSSTLGHISRPSHTRNTSTLSLALGASAAQQYKRDQRHAEQTLLNQGFASMSAILANPHRPPDPLRQNAHHGIPAVPKTRFEAVDRSQIKAYLDSVGPVYDKWLKAVMAYESPSEDGELASLMQLTPFVASSQMGLRQTLDDIPSMFFDPQFRIENPETYAAVKAHASHLRDAVHVVDYNLYQEIHERQDAFFDVLSTLTNLNAATESAQQKSRTLREQAHRLSVDGAIPALQAIALRRRRDNLQLLEGTLSDLSRTLDSLTILPALMSRSEWSDSLDLLEHTSNQLKLPAFAELHVIREIEGLLEDRRLEIASLIQAECFHLLSPIDRLILDDDAESKAHRERLAHLYDLDSRVTIDLSSWTTTLERAISSCLPSIGLQQRSRPLQWSEDEFFQISDNIDALLNLADQKVALTSELKGPDEVLRNARQTAEKHSHFLLSDHLLMQAENIVSQPLPQFMSFIDRLRTRLPNPINDLYKAYVIAFHAESTAKMAHAVEKELWTPTEPTSEVISACASLHSESGLSGKLVSINDQSFHLVPAMGQVLILIQGYMKLFPAFETLPGAEIELRLIEFLKQFNSRTCQVVLGAGAMRSAGLKNITAKHLALASQSISIIVALLPPLRLHIERLTSASSKNIQSDFDRLRRDYLEHQYEVHAKLVTIMGDRLTAHIQSFKEHDYKAMTSQTSPSPWATILIKETTTLHKVLSKYLAADTLEMIVGQVFTEITSRLSTTILEVEIQTEDEKGMLRADMHFIYENLSALKDVTPPPDVLEGLVDGKVLPETAPSMIPPPEEPTEMPKSLDSETKPSVSVPAVPPRLSLAERLRSSAGLSFGKRSLSSSGSLQSPDMSKSPSAESSKAVTNTAETSADVVSNEAFQSMTHYVPSPDLPPIPLTSPEITTYQKLPTPSEVSPPRSIKALPSVAIDGKDDTSDVAATEADVLTPQTEPTKEPNVIIEETKDIDENG